MPPKPAKDQTKSTPTSKSANEKDTIKELQKKVTNLEKEKRTLEQKLERKDDEIERLNVVINVLVQEDVGSNKTNNNSRDSRSAASTNATTGEGNIQDQSKENKRLTEENKKLKEELKKPKDKSKTMQQPGVKKEDTSCSQVSLSDIPLERLIDDSSNQTNNNSRETRSAPAANDTTGEGNSQDQSKEIKRLTLENEELNEKLNKLTRENEELNEKFNNLFEVETSKTAAQVPVPDSETLMKDLLERNKRLVVENSELKEQIKNLKSAASMDLKDAEAQVKQLKERNEKLMEEKNKAVKEVDNLKNRALGLKIYRPVKLAEKFSEVYDNEWTDALDGLLVKINNEKAVIQILLHIVMDAYQFCIEKAETFYGSLKGAVSQTFKTMTLTDSQLKVMNDYRIATAEHLVTNLQEEFCRTNKFDEGNVTHYQNACIRVCWLLAVQDPPIFMEVKENATGAKFDSNKYKCFTKKGNVVDYIVWPVLYLHKGGPLLSKGFAQPK